MVVNLTKKTKKNKISATSLKRCIYKLRLIGSSSCCLKKTPLNRCTVRPISFHKIIFNISVQTSYFCFHSNFLKLPDLVLILSTNIV